MNDQQTDSEILKETKIGVRERRIVETYLRSLSRKTSKGARTREEIVEALSVLNERLKSAVELDRLELLQAREELELEAYQMGPDNQDDLEAQFIAVAAAYSDAKNISYSTWREIGVAKETLEAAKVPRTRRKVPKTWKL